MPMPNKYVDELLAMVDTIGMGTASVVALLMPRIMNDNLAMQMSCEGRSGRKYKFNDVGLGAILIDHLQKFYPYPAGHPPGDKTIKTSKTMMEDWLKHGSTRAVRW